MLGEEHVGAVALVRLAPAIMPVGIVKIVVVPVVRGGGNRRAGEVEGLLNPRYRAVRVTLAQVPFAEETGAVAIAPEELRHRGNPAAKEGTALADRRAAVTEGVQAGHELAARG